MRFTFDSLVYFSIAFSASLLYPQRVEAKLPWHVVPAWKREDLEFVVDLATKIRRETVDDLKKPGDGAWNIGVTFLVRWRAAVFIASEKRTELTVVDESLCFIFAIRGVPVRVIRSKGEETQLPLRACIHKGPEQVANRDAQQSLPFPDPEWLWRLRMITDRHEIPIGFVYEQVNEDGESKNQWRVPFDDAGMQSPPAPPPTPPSITPMARPPVEQPPVEVFVPLDPAEVKTGDGSAE
jgi:hypothetical protein